MDVVIDFTAIWTGVLTTGVIGVITAAAAFVYRLWRLPDVMRDTLEELRLLRESLDSLLAAHQGSQGGHHRREA